MRRRRAAWATFHLTARRSSLRHANRANSCAAVLGSILADIRAGGNYPAEDLERHRLLVEMAAAFCDDEAARKAAHRRYYFAPPRRRT